MSAASAPKPDEAFEPATDTDGWALLEGLRRRLDDQAAQGRKTAAQVTQLAESIAGLVEQQRRRSLWLNVNSFVAYLMFTMLCGAGCYLLYTSRAHELTAARDRVAAERDVAVRNADEATRRAVAREAADNKAWEVYQLLEAGKRAEAVAKLEALRDLPLSKTERAVLAARVHDTQVMEVDAALKAAMASFKAGRPGEVIKPLEAALTGEPPGARAASIHYYLGVAYARTELDKAISHLQAAIAGDVDQDDARFQLASVLDRSGAYAQARAEYDRFATAHPQSPLAVFAMRRSATLARLPAVVSPAVPPAASPTRGTGAPGPAMPPAAGATPLPGPGAAPGSVGSPPAGAPLPAGTNPVPVPGVPAKPVLPAPSGPTGLRTTPPAMRPAGAVSAPPPGASAVRPMSGPAMPSAAGPAGPAGVRAPVVHPWPRPAVKPAGPPTPVAPGPAPDAASQPATKPGVPARPAVSPASPVSNPPAAAAPPPSGEAASPAADPPAER